MLSTFSALLVRGREENKLFFKIEVCSKYFVQDCSKYLLNLITVIEYVNSSLSLTLLGIIHHIYYKYKIFFRAIDIVMDSEKLNQLNNLQLAEKEVDFEVKVVKTRWGRKKKTNTKTLPTINEEDTNDIIEKRDRLVACVLSGNSKQYLDTEQQINEMDINYIKILSNRYESVLSAKMTHQVKVL